MANEQTITGIAGVRAFIWRETFVDVLQILKSPPEAGGSMNCWKDDGGAKEDRTPDLGIANAALSQLSYRPGRVLF